MEAKKLTENQIIRDAREFALHYTPFKRAPQTREDYQENLIFQQDLVLYGNKLEKCQDIQIRKHLQFPNM